MFNWAAQASPAGPEPTTATFLPVRTAGGSGCTQPSSKPRSMMAHSMFLMVTAGSVSARTLEASQGRAGPGTTDLFITPGYRFRVVQGLFTNFHLPKSTLFMLVAAFAGLSRIRGAYAEAIERRYRFFSYGDAMLIA